MSKNHRFEQDTRDDVCPHGEYEANHLRLEVTNFHSFQELRASCANDNTIG